jgi:hypothetical protein
MPNTCVCTAALVPVEQTSWLLIITLGADAVGGVLSTVVVPVTVDVTVLVSACAVSESPKTITQVKMKMLLFIVFFTPI